MTPNAFLSSSCLLKPVETRDCFVALPNHDWISTLAARDRNDVIKKELIPIAEIGHTLSKKIVSIFGKKLDAATKLIGKRQHVRSPQEIFLTLYFPDLPNGDRISDEIVAFMQLHYPSAQISEYIRMSKFAAEAVLTSNDPKLLSLMAATLRRDVVALEKSLPLLEQQVSFMDAFPPPPLKQRSLHRWQQTKLRETIQQESEFLLWRKDLLQRIELSDHQRAPA